MQTVLILVAAVGATMYTTVLAGATGYHCQIVEHLRLQDDGSLRRPPAPTLVGTRFSVHRGNGVIVPPNGGLGWTWNDSRRDVVAMGNSSNAFRMLDVAPAAGEGAHVTQLVINEFLPGTKKSMFLTTGNEVFSGMCE